MTLQFVSPITWRKARRRKFRGQRYIFGQIMYGGHIVNDHDRLLCMTYLEYILDDDIFEEKELCPFNADLKPVVTFVAPPLDIDNELSGEPTELRTSLKC